MKLHDPVCGKRIDLEDAVASEDHGGWAYFFCSLRCHAAFKSSPAHFANAPGAGATHDLQGWAEGRL